MRLICSRRRERGSPGARELTAIGWFIEPRFARNFARFAGIAGIIGRGIRDTLLSPRNSLLWETQKLLLRAELRRQLHKVRHRHVCLIPWEVQKMKNILCQLWREQRGQDIAEYAVMLAVILVIVVGTIRLIGSNANNVFSSVASSVQ
jgi:Flp pilus assembly pilin Flp